MIWGNSILLSSKTALPICEGLAGGQGFIMSNFHVRLDASARFKVLRCGVNMLRIEGAEGPCVHGGKAG